MTPDERVELDKKIAAMQLKIQNMTLTPHIDQQALNAQLKALHSPEFKRLIVQAQHQTQSPEFQQQIAEAQKLAIDNAMNSGEMRKQIDDAIQQIKITEASIANQKLDVHIDQAKLQQELKAASDAIANVKIDAHIDTAKIQKQLEAARKQLEDARRNNQPTNPDIND